MKVRFPIWLVLLIGVGILLQSLVIAQAWSANPFSRGPLGDAQIYWDWAGQIADGQLIGDTPFLSAPLYPYFLGLLRWLGCGLFGVYVVQAVLHILTTLLIVSTGKRRFNPATGLIAGFAYLLLLDPSYYSGRILGVSLQLFTGALLLWQIVRLRERRQIFHQALLGIFLGLAILANPTLLLALPPLLIWAIYSGEQRDLWGGAQILAYVALMVAPATWHNYKASGEFILISAQAGVTFYHGNAAGAKGVYQPIAGVSANRLQQNRDAYDLASDATGEEGWSNTSNYYFGLGMDYLLSHIGDAVVLEGRKLWWLGTGRGYGDLYLPALESQQDFGSRLALTPFSLALFLPLSLLGMALVLRQGWRRALPEITLYLVPCLVVLVFWYSPRYRLPLAPVAILFAAYAVNRGWQRFRPREEESRSWTLWICSGLLLLTGALTGWLNRASDFDNPKMLEPAFLHSVGDTLRAQERIQEALPFLKAAIEAKYDNSVSRYSLALARMKLAKGQYPNSDPEIEKLAIEGYQQAAKDLRATVLHDPKQLDAQENLANLELWFLQLGIGDLDLARSEILAGIELAEQKGDQSAAARLKSKLSQL
jgi:4-amino-4-deoxy-L-arabinose transferase-like glycosyltransferase